MGGRVAQNLIQFANLPIKLLIPSTFNNIREIALKTIPSASKIQIKRVLESVYGFQVDRVHTLNMDGKKKRSGGLLIAKPDYKKAYVTLRNSLSISPELYPIHIIEDDKRKMATKDPRSSIVEEGEMKAPHWLDGRDKGANAFPESGRFGKNRANNRTPSSRGGRHGVSSSYTRSDRRGVRDEAPVKFPWSSMRNSSSNRDGVPTSSPRKTSSRGGRNGVPASSTRRTSR
ncbi:uncharacterized protein LOC124931201 isoform X4 [Impatiens glandulifera]|uniref:uncharacterized protein LOC124931201 isoform X4 n=1 Tax=Impatiens glandulifera TaxID=253017 RepID=UPI001FB144E7|nr:uncharacterized protein LOC124931201 isoform X4 [Impatiens glandulifera]